MVRLIFRIDKNIIWVYYYTHIDHILEDFVHHILERSRSISQPKRHDQILKMTISRTECCLPFVALFDPNKIVTGFEIQLGEDPRIVNTMAEFIHQWQGITIQDQNLIKSPVIHTQAQTSAFFLRNK